VVTEPQDPNVGDGHVDGENGAPHVDVQSVATMSVVIVPSEGLAATDIVDVDLQWTAVTVVDVVRQSAPAG
jgi:hypothetical protein